MNCNTTHYRANSSSVPGDPTCLLLEQGRPELAKGELTAYTLHREKSAEGFVKLGEAQIALRDLGGAERSLNQARLIDGQNPEALNDMGVVQLQRNRVTESAQFFNAALRAKPDYAPAILNMAVLAQTRLNNPQYALQRYHDYLALNPKPANWDTVDATARALEQEINGTPAPASRAPATTPAPQPQAAPPRQTSAAATTRPERPQTPPPANTRSVSQPTEVTQVQPEPVIRGATEPATPDTSRPEHRGFLSRVFHGSKSDAPTAASSTPTTPAVAPMPEPKPVSFPRYDYQAIRKPANGDRAAATQAFAEGSRAQQGKQFAEAIAAYRKAIQLDPAYFDAYYNLGVVSVQSGNLAAGLSAYETALAIEPDSHDARFNFALALRQAGYPLDAAKELERVLARTPSDAYAHYAVANLYATQLRETAKAREHYQKVLQISPAFSQAPAIRSWLYANP